MGLGAFLSFRIQRPDSSPSGMRGCFGSSGRETLSFSRLRPDHFREMDSFEHCACRPVATLKASRLGSTCHPGAQSQDIVTLCFGPGVCVCVSLYIYIYIYRAWSHLEPAAAVQRSGCLIMTAATTVSAAVAKKSRGRVGCAPQVFVGGVRDSSFSQVFRGARAVSPTLNLPCTSPKPAFYRPLICPVPTLKLPHSNPKPAVYEPPDLPGLPTLNLPHTNLNLPHTDRKPAFYQPYILTVFRLPRHLPLLRQQ